MKRRHTSKKIKKNYLLIICLCLLPSLLLSGNKPNSNQIESTKEDVTTSKLLENDNKAFNKSENNALDENEENTEEEISDTEEDEEDEEEEEKQEGQTSVTHQIRYTTDISDEKLQKLFVENPSALGSISVGFTNLGRLINGVKFPQGEEWVIVNPTKSYGTQEVIEYIITAAKAVRKKFPGAPPLRINDLSSERGGYIRPHKSHQNGRDVDIGFYWIYNDKKPTIKKFDVEKNWEFIKAIITLTDVQVILVDRRIQKQLYEYAKGIEENEAWLNSIFKSGSNVLIKHAKRHRGHFHIRFYSPRAQELGKRIHPLLDKAKEEERIAIHKVLRGECLGKIAIKYNSSIKLIRQANHLKSNNIRAGITLFIPLLGPCHNCPEPPDVIVPERRLPENFKTLDTALNNNYNSENAIMLPVGYYLHFYPFVRINTFWLKMDKY